ncbi:MAG: hypothetical protein ACR2N6_07480 [Miltoncostaeaceae bacterium]
MRFRLAATALVIPALAAACSSGGDDVADHPACEAVPALVESYQAQDWDAVDAATIEIRTAIAAEPDDRLQLLRDAVIGVRNDALADTFWIPPDERELTAELIAADPADLDSADRRLRAEILRTRVEGAPDRLPNPPRNDAGARAFLASAESTCEVDVST